jgi:hypothetical protein
MAAIDNVIKHFENTYEKKSFEVPEWGPEGQPLKIFVEPMTLKQQSEILELIQTKGAGAGFVHAICTKALDESGKRIFAGDKLFLTNKADPDLVIEVGQKIWNLAKGKDIDAHLQNLDEECEEIVEELKKK